MPCPQDGSKAAPRPSAVSTGLDASSITTIGTECSGVGTTFDWATIAANPDCSMIWVKPSGRIGRVEGNIGVARLKDRQGGDNQIDSSVNENADPRVRSDAKAYQTLRERVRPQLHVAICEGLPGRGNRNRCGRLRRLEREEMRERQVARDIRRPYCCIRR